MILYLQIVLELGLNPQTGAQEILLCTNIFNMKLDLNFIMDLKFGLERYNSWVFDSESFSLVNMVLPDS